MRYIKIILLLLVSNSLFGQNNLGSGGTNSHNVRVGNTTGNYIQFADSTNLGQINFKNPSTTASMTRYLFIADPFTKTAGTQQSPFYFGLSNNPQSGNSGNNVMMFGWNLSPGGAKVESGKAYIGESWESNYRPLAPLVYPLYVEKHEIYMPSYSNIQRRLSSYTIQETSTGANFIDYYHMVNQFHLRDTTGGDYFSVTGKMNGDRTASMVLTTGAQTSFLVSVDSVNNNTTFTNNSTAPRKATSLFQINNYKQFQINDYLSRPVLSSVSNAGNVFTDYGLTSYPTLQTFNTSSIASGFGVKINADANTVTGLQTRGQLHIYGGSNLCYFGVRSDINMGYIGMPGSFAIRANALQVGPNAGASLPLGITLQVNSNLANTSALQRWQTTTDSVKMFVTSASPNSLLTGRIGDLALGTNGGFYFKKTGSNTNTGWVDFAALVTESTTIGAFQSSGNSNGLTLSGTDIRLHAASVSTPGGVNVGLQTFGVGADTKIFNGTGSGQITVDGNTDNTPAGINFTQIGGTDLMGLFHINSSDADNARLRFALEQDGGLVDQIVVGTLNDDRGMYSRNGLYEDVTTVTTSPYTVLYGDRNIYLDGTTITVNLQAIGTSTAETKIGRVIYFFNDNATSVTITPNGSETINDASSLTLLTNTGVTLLAVTGTKWITRD